MKALRFIFAVVVLGSVWSTDARATCRKIEPQPNIRIDPAALSQLQTIGFSAQDLFSILYEVSLPEANGCWGAAAGNFDKELLSAGAIQSNLGQGTLQPLLLKFRKRYPSESQFNGELTQLMRRHGSTLFSKECTNSPATKVCAAWMRERQNQYGDLQDHFKQEVQALFESEGMIQIQMDAFVTLVTRVVSDLKRLFPRTSPNGRQIKWAIDMKVQQGGFPGDADIQRIRQRHANRPPAEQQKNLLSILRWYQGLCQSVDQDGVRLDCDFNLAQWQKALNKGISVEQADLILLTHLRSRVASKSSGLYQALTFQRRIKIALGVGSVAGRRDSI